MSASVRSPLLPDGEYDIDVSSLLKDDRFEENFAIRYGFVPESIDDDLPFQLVKDTTTATATTALANNTSAEELYILKAESTVSNTNPILFEGSLNKSSSSSIPDAALSNDYILVYDSVGKNFKLEKLNGVIRMSKSRNESTLLNKLAKLESMNKEKVREHNELIKQFAMETQRSIRPRAKVRNGDIRKADDKKIVIPQAIPLPKTGNDERQLQNKKAKTISSTTKNGGKISTLKIRQSIKSKSQRSSPLIQSFKKSESVANSTSNSDIDEMDLNKLIDAELESDTTNSKIIQPKPTLPPSLIASKRLPAGNNLSSSPQDQESDSDLGSLLFELEEALENNTNVEDESVKIGNVTNDDGWGEPNMDFDMDEDEDDFDFNEDGDSNFNIVITESPLSPADSSKKAVPVTRELTPSGPISMKELASLRVGGGGSGGGNYRESSPVIATPGLTSSALFKKQPKIANISAVATPKLADDTFTRPDQTAQEENDEDISEEE